MAREVTIGGDGKLFVGEDKTLTLEVLQRPAGSDEAADILDIGVPIDIAAWVIAFDVRKLDKSTGTPLVTKTATVVGTFSATRSLNTQRARVILTDDDLNVFKEATYRHSWKRMTAGNETVLAYGDFTPQKATAP